jgi:uncharacterized protein YkwD
MSPSKLTRPHHPVRLLVCGALIGGALSFAGGSPASAAGTLAAADCPDQDLAPTTGNTDEIRASILCLTNAERSRRGLALLHENTKLRSAASRHSSDMVRDGYFAHTTPDGETFVKRILAAGYTTRNDGWSLGENLAWGTGNLSTPRGIHHAWMRSRGHRANILTASYRELGIGVRPGVPKDAGVGATYTTDYGAKR